MKKELIVLGAGGHGGVVAEIAQLQGYRVVGFLDDGVAAGTIVLGAPVLGPIPQWREYPRCLYAMGMGDNALRKRFGEGCAVAFPTLIHPSAVVSPSAALGAGTVVMAGAVVNPGSKIGVQGIVNTHASIDHDCLLGDYCHVSPGAALGGAVTLGDMVHVGIGAAVKNNISICGGAVIGAGAAVVKDITEPGVYVGVPARRIK